MTYYADQEEGWTDVKQAIEDLCVQSCFIRFADDVDASRLQAIEAELKSEFDLKGNIDI